MNRRTILLIGIGLLVAGSIATVTILVMPMPGDGASYKVPNNALGSQTTAPSNKTAAANVARTSVVNHAKPSLRLELKNADRIILEPNRSVLLRLAFKLKDDDVQSVTLTPRPDQGLRLAPPEDAYTPNQDNEIFFSSRLSASTPGKYYVMFDATIHTATASELSAPVGIAVYVVDPALKNTPPAVLSQKPNGVSLKPHSMPAQETIQSAEK